MARPSTPGLFVPSRGLVVAREAGPSTERPEIVLVFEVLIEDTWQDFSCYVRGASLQRGTQSPTGPFEASVLTLTLDNPDGLLSPWVQITPWSSQLARVFRANIGVRLSITSTSDAAEDLFASNPTILRGPAAPTTADGKVGDLWLAEGASTVLWGPKGPADALPPPQFLGEHFWSTTAGTGLIWFSGTSMKWSRYDRNGVDRLNDFLDYARPGATVSISATPPPGRGYLDATLGTVTTPDPGPLPDEFTVITRVTGPARSDPSTFHAIVGQWESSGQYSWRLERSEADGHLNFDTFDGPAGPPLAYPTLAASVNQVGSSTTTGTAITLPTGITAGDLLVAFMAIDGDPQLTPSAGWFQIGIINTGTVGRLSCFARIATATGADALTVTSQFDRRYCASAHRFTGHGVTNVTTDIKVAGAEGDGPGHANPPLLNTYQSRPWTWLAACGLDRIGSGYTITAVPSGYTQVHNINSGTGTADYNFALARKDATAAAEDPSPFAINPLWYWQCLTIAVPGTGAGPPSTVDSDGSVIAGALLQENFDSFADWAVTVGPVPFNRVGRTGKGVRLAASGVILSYTIPAASESDIATVGFYFQSGTTTARAIARWCSDTGATVHLSICVTSSGALEIRRGTNTGTILATSATNVVELDQQRNYIEVQARLHDTTGFVTAHVNGVLQASATNIDTRNAGTKSTFDRFDILNAGDYDDLYIVMGGPPGQPLGPARFGFTHGMLHEPFDDLGDWTTVSGTPAIVAGRTGTAVDLPNTATVIRHDLAGTYQSYMVTFGFALRVTVLPTSAADFVQLKDSTGALVAYLRLASTGVFTVSGTFAATTSAPITTNTWYYVECQILCGGAGSGFAQIRINDVVINTATDANVTAPGGTGTITRVEISGVTAVANHTYIDDLYIRTGTMATYEGSQTIPPAGSGGGGGSTQAVTTSRPTALAALPVTATAETLATSVKLDDAGTTHATLWRSYDDGATWNVVGSGDLTVPTDTVFDSSTVMRIGALGAGVDGFAGRIHTVELRTGLDPSAGTLSWRFNADEYPGTGTVYADPRGRAWTLSGAGIITRHLAQTFSDRVATITHDTSTVTITYVTFFPLPSFAVAGSVVRTTAQPETPVKTNWVGTEWGWAFPAPSLPIPRIEFARSFPVGPTVDWPERSVIVTPPLLPNVEGDPGARYDVYQLLASGVWDWLGYWVADPAPLAVWNDDLAARRWQLFVGMVDSWVDHDLAEGDRFVEVQASDGFKFLANHEFTQLETPVGEGETGGARITRILDATRRQPFTDAVVPSQGWRWGFRVDPGDVQMAGWDRGRPALEEIQQTVLAEGGRCFVDRFGDLVFLDNDRLTATDREIDWEVGDGRDTGSICATAILTSCDDLDVVNQVGVGRAEAAPAPGEPAEPSTDVWRRDEESITLHGQRTGRYLDLPHLLDTDSGRIADRILSATAALDYHISRLEVAPLSELQGWEFVVNVELMDLVRVTRVHSLQRLDDVARVVGISHTMTPGTYAVTLTLGPPVRIIAGAGWDLSLWDNPPDDLWSDS